MGKRLLKVKMLMQQQLLNYLITKVQVMLKMVFALMRLHLVK